MNLSQLHKAGVLDQIEGYWEKLFAALIFKVGPQTITLEDLQRLDDHCRGEKNVLFSHGHVDSIDFAIIPREEAESRAKAHNEALQEKRN